MTKELVSFALNFPRYSYASGNTIVRDCINLSIDDRTAIEAVSTKGAPISRHLNVEYVSAFLENREALNLVGIPTFDQFVTPYPISADVQVPVKPLTTCLDGGKLRAIFSVGWATVPFNDFQWRLLSTIMEEAVFSLEDLKDANGEFHSFPRENSENPDSRKSLLMKRGDFQLLQPSELREVTDNYLTALERAKVILASYVVKDAPEENQSVIPSLPLFPDLQI